jgi:hypothetical protein
LTWDKLCIYGDTRSILWFEIWRRKSLRL